ncbi:MAG: AMP-binding protein [Rhizorhabdus sp.]
MAEGLLFASGLRARGVGPGDVVGVQLPAWSEWMAACIGIAHVGAVMLPIVSIYGAKEMGFILRQSGAKLLVTPDRWRSADYAAVLAECGDLPALHTHVVIGEAAATAVSWVEMTARDDGAAPALRDPDDLAMLVYTSGTTADPKGVCHSSRTLLSELIAVQEARLGIAEVVLSPWPPGHVAGACTMMRFIVQGIKLVLMDQWDASAAAMLIEREGVSAGSFTPFHLTGILDAADRDGRDLSSFISVLVGAAPVPPTLIERCAARGLNTFRSYGSSEHPTVTTGFPGDGIDKRLTTEGRLMTGAEMRFVDDDGNELPAGVDGEMVTRGPELFMGYLDSSLNAAAMLPGGWFRTGDIGHFDPDGYLVISDRKKDVIIRGGENISSREVEDILLADPMIADAACVAYPDERMGEIVCAYVVARAGAEVTLETVRAHFSTAGAAKQKTPERVVPVAELPRNSTGKILKHELRARAQAKAKDEAA